MPPLSLLPLLLLALTGRADDTVGEQTRAVELDFFESHVRPILAAHCMECHGPERQRSGLRLDRAEFIERGGERGALFDREAPDRGLLLRALSYEDEELEMPPRSKLPAAELQRIVEWVERGAPLPSNSPAASNEASPGPTFDLLERSAHWAYLPLREPALPEQLVGAEPIDHLLDARLTAENLEAAQPASPRSLLRRVSFDLLGLPPTPAETATFLADRAPGAYERLVDRLLASPHFGERWGRHWLDLMRFAETRGHEFDYAYPNAYQYRDYVLRALNADVPFDEFAREHLAGDLLDEPRLHPTLGFDESVLGTGFWFLGDEVHSPVDIRADQTDRVAGRVDTLSKAFLGLTVACARCHDHKFDAITTEDYYALCGYASSGSYRSVRFETERHNAALAAELRMERRVQAPAARAVVARGLDRRFARLAEYLRAASSPSDALDSDDLDADVLAAWVEHLAVAKDDAEDPLHPLALFGPLGDEARLVELGVQGLLAEARREGSQPAPVLIEDFGAPGRLLQNGFAFERRTRGDAVVGARADELVREFVPRDGVYFDETWNVLRRHPDSEGDPSAVSWEQAGRTLRTRTFELEQPKLYYLVRGAGDVLASVDAHRLIQGPLHGASIRKLLPSDRFRWVEHDLAGYVGHRVHVEFSPPSDDPRFGIAAVAQGTEPPRLEGPAASLELLLERDVDSLDALLGAYRGVFADAVDGLLGADLREEQLELINFLLAHPELGEGPVADELAVVHHAFEFERLRTLLHDVRPVSRLAPAMLEGSGVNEYILIRGSHLAPGAPVERRFLEVFGGKQAPSAGPGSGRIELAERIIASPLFPRVFVNRAWHHLFGLGLVATTDDFGVMGELPTHPELLEHLATTFRDDDYSVKRLVRRLVCTQAYRRAGRSPAAAIERDPTNRLLHGRPARRLSAEAIRDALLAVSGRLDRRAYGRSVPIYLTEFLEGRGRPASGPLDGEGRRSVYLSVRRNFPVPLFAVFDFPSPAAPVGRRSVSNVPAQALTMMNDPFVWQQAEVWADAAIAADADVERRVVALYESAFTREPTARELESALHFVQGGGADERAAWRDLCHALFNTKEFVFVP